jgi:hypothetical protein
MNRDPSITQRVGIAHTDCRAVNNALLHLVRLRQRLYSAFLKSIFLKGPTGDWSIRRLICPGEQGSCKVRFGFRADQSDHRRDPEANLPSNMADAEPLGPEGQRCLHFLGVALLDGTPTKLFSFRPSAG